MNKYLAALVGGGLVATSLTVSSKDLTLPTVPMTASAAVEPNVMLLFDSSGSMGRTFTDPDTGVPSTRLQVAKNVAVDLVNSTDGVRFCLARFRALGGTGIANRTGGHILRQCGANKTDIVNGINAIPASDWTPLSEAFYEVTRYFRGMSSYYNTSFVNNGGGVIHSGGRYVSPIQYRCQKNFILALTDGAPSYDLPNIPNNQDADITGQCSEDSCKNGLPNWDGKATGGANQYSDGTSPGSESSSEGSTYYLDDLAKFAWDVDARTSGNDLSGKSFQDSNFPKQNIHTYTVGFLVQNQMLQDAADYGSGEFYHAQSTSGLKTALFNALSEISKQSLSSSAVGTSSTQVSTDTVIFQARYKGDTWQGFLYANKYNPATREIILNGGWEAGALIPDWNSRNIFFKPDEDYSGHFTQPASQPSNFRWNRFTNTGKSSYFNNDQSILQYLRGRTDGWSAVHRERETVLGDIVNSSPVYVGPPVAGRVVADPKSLNLQTSYNSFVTQQKDRAPIVYVGANDGMLHGFTVNAWDPSGADNFAAGQEVMAYMPSKSLGNLKELARLNYQHQFFVDGTPTTADVYFDSDHPGAITELGKGWKSVLVGGLRRGGQGIYALNITDPNLFLPESHAQASKVVMWEFTDRDSAELGYTYSQPQIMRFNDGRWYAVFGNGYNNTESDNHVSTTGDAVLFIVDIQTGALKKMMSTGVGLDEEPTGAAVADRTPNGLAAPAGYDENSDGMVEVIYAGDLYGNMWRFDVSDANNTANWKTAKLFTACTSNTCGSSYTPQPITTAPQVARYPFGGAMIFFGTGRFIDVRDKNPANVTLSSFYGLFDTSPKTPVSSVLARSDLLEQTITEQGELTLAGTTNKVWARLTSANPLERRHKGWRIDLKYPTSGTSQLQGEQVVNRSHLFANRIAFVTTNNSSSDRCSSGVDFILMELNPLNGSAFTQPIIDMDGDGKVNSSDQVQGSNGTHRSASGTQVSGDIAVLEKPDADKTDVAHKVQSKAVSADNDIQVKVTVNGGTDNPGRNSWREIYQP